MSSTQVGDRPPAIVTARAMAVGCVVVATVVSWLVVLAARR
ncbi:MAG: hypothetical protein QOD68_814 [Actinomycetota bacterium]|jgi:hypothetical protein|nr:hypothetical protein [Actinomycetota bacterium]